jgi:hypothetical protein
MIIPVVIIVVDTFLVMIVPAIANRAHPGWGTLLHAQRGERIDARRAARGNPARNECHTNHEHRHKH